MEKQSVLEFLSSFVKQQKSEVNYGTYRETTRSSLLKDGLGTRANSVWKQSQFVVAFMDDSGARPLNDYLKGWNQLTRGIFEQYLVLEEPKGTWTVYDKDGNNKGGIDYLKSVPQHRIGNLSSLESEMPSDYKESSYYSISVAAKSKPFILLAGISGTGKSRIVKKMAFDSCPNIDDFQKDETSPGNYQLVEVKPNWHDSTEVLGYESEIGGIHYVTTPFIKFLVKAMCYPDIPFFVCMDEMNLAPVEQYFAEFLSVLESRKLIDGKITSEPLLKADVFNKAYAYKHDIFVELGLKKVPTSVGKTENEKLGKEATTEAFDRQDIVQKLQEEGLRLPENLIVIGTVNMDETTHQFSRKVIDRAMTIEMNIADGTEAFDNFFKNREELKYRNEPISKDIFLPRYVQASEAMDSMVEEDRKYLIENVPQKLIELNGALNNTPFKIAYRVQNELVLYFSSLRQENAETAKEELFATALDGILMMKVLPRIEGDEDLLENPLDMLANYTQGLSQSAKKVKEMSDRLKTAHFTSFWP